MNLQPSPYIKTGLEQKVRSMLDALPEPGTGSLLTGRAGQAMLYGYAGRYFDTDDYSEKIGQLISGIFDELQQGKPGATFCNGIAGILWSIDHMKNKKMIELDEDLSFLHDHLKKTALAYARALNFDFLHGSDGIVFYLLRAKAADQDFISDWLAELDRAALKNENGCYWESMVHDNKVYNLSLSHGISSRIIILAETVKQFPGKETAKELLNGAVQFLLSHKDKTILSVFPGYMHTNGSYTDSRLGWCYGDQGNAIALWRAGRLVNNESWKTEAINIMRHAANRTDLSKHALNDAGLCHGTSGTAHIFHRFYTETGIAEFNDAAMFWLEQTFKFEGANGYKKWAADKRQYEDEPNFLEGTAGICMILLSFMSGRQQTMDWDECLLLS